MLQAVAVEWFKLRRLRLFRASVLLGIALSLFWLAFALWMAQRGAPAVREQFVERLTFPGAYEQAFSLAASFGETFLAIVAATFVANEYSWGTWRLILPTGLPRWQALGAKLLALLAGTVVFVLATAFVPLSAAPLLAALWLDRPALVAPDMEAWLVAIPPASTGHRVARGPGRPGTRLDGLDAFAVRRGRDHDRAGADRGSSRCPAARARGLVGQNPALLLSLERRSDRACPSVRWRGPARHTTARTGGPRRTLLDSRARCAHCVVVPAPGYRGAREQLRNASGIMPAQYRESHPWHGSS